MIWLYSSEVTYAAAGGLMTFGIFGTLLLQSMTLESLMAAYKPEGVFFMFGGVTIIGFFYVFFLLKETKKNPPMSDQEKKSLYSKKTE
jgi:hypothetical protein